MANYELGVIRRAAARGVMPNDFDDHERVIYHTLRYCYKTYNKTPTESVRRRLKEFSDPVIEFHYGRKD